MLTHQVSPKELPEASVAGTGEDVPKTQASRSYRAPVLCEIGTLKQLQGGPFGDWRDKGGYCKIA